MELFQWSYLNFLVLLAQTGLFIWVVKEVRLNRRLTQTYLAHTLRTPLSVVLGSLAALNRHGEKMSQEEMRRLLDTALKSGEELNRLITGLISLQDDRAIRLEEEATRKSG